MLLRCVLSTFYIRIYGYGSVYDVAYTEASSALEVLYDDAPYKSTLHLLTYLFI